MKKTKKAYQEYLNSMDATFSHDDRIIGGKFRWGMYGDELRKHDPIAFEVGYNEWKRNN